MCTWDIKAAMSAFKKSHMKILKLFTAIFGLYMHARKIICGPISQDLQVVNTVKLKLH